MAGTVTFLFSDIEGGTARWETDAGAMAAVLAENDAVMRDTLTANGARIFKTMGGAFCAAFSRAPDAVAAALAAQRALTGVRVAIHSGTAEERDGDYFGPALNRAARLLGIGHAGQVLVSAAAAQLLENSMPASTNLRDLGEHRLKDLAQPEHVWQLVAPDLPETFPALRSLEHLTNNLPAQLTTFVGRDREMSQIKSLVGENRLVTLIGAGGAGKTRCALQAGAALLDAWDDGVWFAELAPIAQPGFVANAIAQALHMQEQPGRPMLDSLRANLKRKRLLLILDNCEHLIAEAGRIAAAILADCPGVHILATSREALNIPGEATYRMPSMAVPRNSEALIAEGLAAYGAVQLFVERAHAANHRFALRDENASYVAEICRRLDGIPLALELAAARIKILSPQQLAQKLDERFRVLTGGDRSALPRHQTMRALIDWSYDLLSEGERELFRALSVFAGGFTAVTAAGVCVGKAGVDPGDGIRSLVDKSLIQAEPAGGSTRYRLLESTRQYARERLAEAGEEQGAAGAHARAFEKLSRSIDDAWENTSDAVWLAQIEPELENYRAALNWAFAIDGDVQLGQRLAAALRKVWLAAAVAEGQRWIDTAVAQVDAQTPRSVVAALDLAKASLASRFHQFGTVLECGERALAAYRELGDRARTALAMEIVADALVMYERIPEGEALLRDALAERRALGCRKSVAGILLLQAQARQFAGDTVAAKRLFTEALSAAHGAGAERFAALIAMNLAETEFASGNAEAALGCAREAASLLRSMNETQMLAFLLSNEAAYLVALRRYDESRAIARQAFDAARDAQREARLLALRRIAAVAALRPGTGEKSREDRVRAAGLAGYVDAAFVEESRDDTEQIQYEAVSAALREALGPDELARIKAAGSNWSDDRAVAEAMLV